MNKEHTHGQYRDNNILIVHLPTTDTTAINVFSLSTYISDISFYYHINSREYR